MGFGKSRGKGKKPKGEQLELELDESPKAKKEKRFKETRDTKFTPSTDEDLKGIRKRARKAERLRNKAKGDRKSSKHKLPAMAGDRLRQALINHEPFRVYASNLFDKFIECIKDNDLEKPRYRAYMADVDGEGQFMFEINTCLSRMSWVQLNRLLQTAATSEEKGVGVATRTWSEAREFVQWCLYVALTVVEKKGKLRLTDRSVLDTWPVEERKRKSKGDSAVYTEKDEELRKLSAQAAKDDDEDEDDDDSDDEDEDDEDSDDEDDEEDDDDGDDEKPAKKKASAKSKSSKNPKPSSKDSDEDDEDDTDDGEDDEDDEDDDDVKPKKGSKEKSVKGKKSKKADKPVKKGKATKIDKKAKAAPAKKAKKSKLELSDSTVLKKVKPRDKGGPRTKLLDLIPKKGLSLKKITAAAKEAGLNTKKVAGHIEALHKYGFVAVVE